MVGTKGWIGGDPLRCATGNLPQKNLLHLGEFQYPRGHPNCSESPRVILVNIAKKRRVDNRWR